MVALYATFKEGSFDLAQKLQEDVNYIAQSVGEGRYLACYKSALKMRGVDAGSVRPPHRELQKDEKKKLKELMKKFDFR